MSIHHSDKLNLSDKGIDNKEQENQEFISKDDLYAKNDHKKYKLKDKSTRSRSSVNRRSVIGYSLVVGKKRTVPNGKDQGVNPKLKMSFFSSVKDRVFSFVNRETEAERKTRLRLVEYRGILQSEILIIERAVLHHSGHAKNLLSEFDNQELQLQKWGLLKILPIFRLQAWLRIGRTRLLEEIAQLCLKLMKGRFERSAKVITQYIEVHVTKNFPLAAYNDFCQPPPNVVAKDSILNGYFVRLSRMDRLCQSYLNNFRQMLPELKSKAFSDRKDSLIHLLTYYGAWVKCVYPIVPDLEGGVELEEQSVEGLAAEGHTAAAVQGGPGQEKDPPMTWESFCSWNSARQRKIFDLETKFSSFVEDEREREGRLFRRWVTLACDQHAPADQAMSGDRPEGESAAVAEEAASLTADKSGAATPRPSEMPPRSILAFMKYFAIRVLCVIYGITDAAHIDTMIVLVTVLVSRRISSRMFSYPNPAMLEKDAIWRKKCLIIRTMHPTKYGVAAMHAMPLQKTNLKKSTISAAIPIVAATVTATTPISIETADSPQTSPQEDSPIGTSPIGTSPIETSPIDMSSDLLKGSVLTNRSDFQVQPDGCEDPLDYDGQEEEDLYDESAATSTKVKFHHRTSGITTSVSCCTKGGDATRCALCREVSYHTRCRDPLRDDPSDHSAPYSHCCRLLSGLGSCFVPKECLNIIMQAMRWMLIDATNVSTESRFEVLGADQMFPILVLVLAHSDLPFIHLLLNVLHEYGELDRNPEAEYYTTCMEAAVAYVVQLKEGRAQQTASQPMEHRPSNLVLHAVEGDDEAVEAEMAAFCSSSMTEDSEEREQACLASLGAWLRDQQTMEDTISILQQEGWMV